VACTPAEETNVTTIPAIDKHPLPWRTVQQLPYQAALFDANGYRIFVIHGSTSQAVAEFIVDRVNVNEHTKEKAA
jgi:hypothetical protein